MRKYFIILPFGLTLSSCVSPSVEKLEKLANEFCECRTIEKNQSSLQGEQCFQEWDKKYGKMELSEKESIKFNKLIQACQPE